MADDQFQVSALAGTFRQMLAETPATLTVAELKTHRATALAAVMARTEVISLTMEGGSGSSVITCPPSVVLAACVEVLAEQGIANAGTGTAHLQMSSQRIET